jgi:SNF2 family DNA or RNA helicase
MPGRKIERKKIILSIDKKLRPYQKTGRDVALDCFRSKKFFLIADEMGLGKSIQALAVADKLRKKYNRIIIVSPAGLVEKWKDEIKKHLPPNRVYSITIVSYNEIIKPENLHFHTKIFYDLLVLDEAHYLKDFTSMRTRAVLGAPGDNHRTLASVSRFTLGLSGTWPPNRVGEIYPLLFACGHELTVGLTYEQFLYKYAEKVWETPFGTKHSGVKNEKALRQLLSDTIVRRRLDDVEKDIPAGTIVNIPVECDAKTLAEEKELLLE